MPYLDDICRALIRVLENAAFHKDRIRLAGYTANIDFWANEIRHALDCLAGYQMRFARLKEARIAQKHPPDTDLDATYVTPTLNQAEIERLKGRLLAASARFMRLCTPQERADEFETLLGIRIRDRRPNVD